jgi:hypothetical protein
VDPLPGLVESNDCPLWLLPVEEPSGLWEAPLLWVFQLFVSTGFPESEFRLEPCP